MIPGLIAILFGGIATIVQFDQLGTAFNGGLGQVLSAAWPLIHVAVGVVLVAIGLRPGNRDA